MKQTYMKEGNIIWTQIKEVLGTFKGSGGDTRVFWPDCRNMLDLSSFRVGLI